MLLKFTFRGKEALVTIFKSEFQCGLSEEKATRESVTLHIQPSLLRKKQNKTKTKRKPPQCK